MVLKDPIAHSLVAHHDTLQSSQSVLLIKPDGIFMGVRATGVKSIRIHVPYYTSGSIYICVCVWAAVYPTIL